MSSNEQTTAANGQQSLVELQPDESENADVDSALGDERSALTQSLRSSLRESIQENGRGMRNYGNGYRVLRGVAKALLYL